MPLRIKDEIAREVMSEVPASVRYLVACALAELDDSLTNHEADTLEKFGTALVHYVEDRNLPEE